MAQALNAYRPSVMGTLPVGAALDEGRPGIEKGIERAIKYYFLLRNK